MNKKLIAIIALIGVIIILSLVLILAGRKKEGKATAFPDSDYPVDIDTSGKDIILNLDGSKTKELTWEMEIEDEAYVTVEQTKKEKNGKAQYKISPVRVGLTDITFTRKNKIGDYEYTAVNLTLPVSVQQTKDGLKVNASEGFRLNSRSNTTIGEDTDHPIFINNSDSKNPELVYVKGTGDWFVEDISENIIRNRAIDENGLTVDVIYEEGQYATSSDASKIPESPVIGEITIASAENQIRQKLEVKPNPSGGILIMKAK